MRKILRSLTIVPLIIISLATSAQERTVSGTVLSQKDNEPIANATVTNRNTKKSTTTTSTGRFTLKASKGDVLEITSIGYLKLTVPVGDGSEISVSLNVNEKQLSEVVVTSMGIKKEKRGLGFSSQELKGDDVAQTQRENFFNSIQGRVAGATLVQTSGAPGASSNIVLRGFNSLSGSNSPLIVVDGLPISNNTLDQHQLASNGDNRSNDYTNRAADINPDDIESINVLKGPEATALYGIEAGSGAIIITTKKARAGKLKVHYENNFRTTHVYRFPHIQKVYGPGLNGIESNTRLLFGPRYPAGTIFYDNIEEFFQDGFQQKHSVTLEGGKNKTAFRLNTSWRDETGTVPNTGLEQLQARLTLNQKGKNFDINLTGAYTNTRNDKTLRGFGATTGSGSFLLNLILWPQTERASQYLLPNGTRKFFLDPDATGNQPNEADNPFFEVHKNASWDKTDRGLLNLTASYDPLDWLNFTVRAGADVYTQNGLTYYHPESNQSRTTRGQVEEYTQKYKSYNGVFIATVKKNFGKFKTTWRAGVANDDWKRETFARLGRTLKDSVTKSLSVATTIITSREVGADTLTMKRLQGVFGEVVFNYNDVVYLTGTGRKDWTSTLPVQARSFFYPAVSVAVILSDIIAPDSKWLDFWKVRGSRAETAKDIAPYGSQSWYTNAPGMTNAYGWSYDFYNQNPLIIPEKQKTYEIGTEFRLFNNRLTLDYTFYHTRNLDQIVRLVRLSYGTGFVLNTSNISDTENKGHEVSLGITPIKKKGFTWRMNYNFNRMTNRITRIPDNIPEFYNSDTWLGDFRAGLTRNGTITQLTGRYYLTNNAGQRLIDPTSGYPVISGSGEMNKIADRNPDFQLGIGNTLMYKNLSLSFLLDVKVGGDILNANELWMVANGTSLRTLDREIPRIYPGVLNDGLQNSATPTINTISVLPHYQSSIYQDRTMAVDFVEKDVDWLRMRDITLRYAAGKNLLQKLRWFSSASAYITATDVFLITDYSGVDPAASGNSAATLGNGSSGIDFGSLSIPRGINIGLSFQFANK